MAGSVSGSSKGDGVKKASPPTPLRKERGVITEEGYSKLFYERIFLGRIFYKIIKQQRALSYWVSFVISLCLDYFNAWSRSAMMSSTFSIPTERRIKSGATPASRSCSSVN